MLDFDLNGFPICHSNGALSSTGLIQTINHFDNLIFEESVNDSLLATTSEKLPRDIFPKLFRNLANARRNFYTFWDANN
ncbi:hypothetical protein LT85_2925 [Collimonas arenae]|uniref:Uncharacterized protein n=1 Tax=Collimonas arenae TaxID=279058 RepID=A0A0A1FBF8_9BURK|nr:hypothetical protein LT85_2925 [Collimonas arenae]